MNMTTDTEGTVLSDDDADKLRALRQAMNDKLHAAAQTVAEVVAIKDRVAGELRAQRAARLAGPNAALWRALYGVQQRTRKRRPTLAGAARQAARAGVEVAVYEMRPDGTIGVVIGKPGEATTPDNNDNDKNEWDGVLQ